MVKINKDIIYLRLRFVLLICLIVLVIFNIMIFTNRALSVKIVDMRVVVGEKIGMVINDSVLDYGILPRGTSINKKVLLKNEYKFPVIVDIKLSGALKDYVYGDSKITLSVGETKEYSVDLIIPGEMEFGNYTGKMIFEFRRN